MSFSKELLEEINSVRTNPSGYVDKILKYKEYFNEKVLKIPGEDAGIQTHEGAPAYDEAANFLKEAKSVDPFIPSKGLTKISKEYLNNIQNVDQDKIDSIDIKEIIEKYGNFNGELNQLMEFGSKTPEQVVVCFLVCDGDSSRDYRTYLLNPNLKKIGIATGKNNTYQNSTIVVAATEFKNKDNSDDTETFDENENNSEKLKQNAPVPLMTLSDMINPDRGNEEEERKKKEEEEKKKKEEEERLRKEAEEAERKKREEEEERLRKEAEEAERKKKEEEEEKEAEEAERKKKEEEERLRKEAEEAERKKKEEEEERLRKEAEEAERKKKEEEERLRKEAEEAERKKREKEEERLRKEEERKRIENMEKEKQTENGELKNRKEDIKKEEKQLPKLSDNEKEVNIINTIILIYLILLLLLSM